MKELFNIEKIIYILVFFLLVFFTQDSFQSKSLFIFAVIINLRLIYHYRAVTPILLLFFFLISYLVPFYQHFFLGKAISYHDSFSSSYFIAQVLIVYSLFLLSIFIFTQNKIKYLFVNQRLTDFKSTHFLFLFLLLLIIVLSQIGLKGQNMLSGYSYGQIDYNRSPLYEYTLIFLSLMALVVNNSKIKKHIFLLLVLYLIFKDLIYGGRITTLMLLLLVYILFFENKISKKKIYLILTFMVFCLSVASVIRSNPIIFLQGQLTFNDIFISLLGSNSSDIISTNQGDVLQSSSRLLGFVETGILSFQDRLFSFFYFITSILIPG